MLAGCTRAPDSKSVDPPHVAAVTAEPGFAQVQAHKPAQGAAIETATAEGTPPPAVPPTSAAQAPASADPARALFDIIVRLVNEPGARQELAPEAKYEDYGVKDVVKRPLKDAKADLGWLFETEHAEYLPPGKSSLDVRGAVVECDATKLTCSASFGGGQMDFTFARQGDKVVLTEVMKQLN